MPHIRYEFFYEGTLQLTLKADMALCSGKMTKKQRKQLTTTLDRYRASNVKFWKALKTAKAQLAVHNAERAKIVKILDGCVFS